MCSALWKTQHRVPPVPPGAGSRSVGPWNIVVGDSNPWRKNLCEPKTDIYRLYLYIYIWLLYILLSLLTHGINQCSWPNSQSSRARSGRRPLAPRYDGAADMLWHNGTFGQRMSANENRILAQCIWMHLGSHSYGDLNCQSKFPGGFSPSDNQRWQRELPFKFMFE